MLHNSLKPPGWRLRNVVMTSSIISVTLLPVSFAEGHTDVIRPSPKIYRISLILNLENRPTLLQSDWACPRLRFCDSPARDPTRSLIWSTLGRNGLTNRHSHSWTKRSVSRSIHCNIPFVNVGKHHHEVEPWILFSIRCSQDFRVTMITTDTDKLDSNIFNWKLMVTLNTLRCNYTVSLGSWCSTDVPLYGL